MVVADFIDGRHCLLYGAPPQGFRRAVEDALGLRQMRVRVVYDDSEFDPAALLRREAAPGITNSATLPPGVWWVEAISSDRAMHWATEAVGLAELTRHSQPWARALLALPLPVHLPEIRGLDIVWRCAEPLGRMDLEVAARYQSGSREQAGALARLRMALAVEMASPLLPGPKALDVLSYWMAAPDVACLNPQQFAQHCPLPAAHPDLAEFWLWRAQYQAFLPEIECARLKLVRSELPRWRVPYRHVSSDGSPAKLVSAPELLEISHLCAQLSEAGITSRSPIRQRLQRLRHARNALSHMEPLSPADATALVADLDSYIVPFGTDRA